MQFQTQKLLQKKTEAIFLNKIKRIIAVIVTALMLCTLAGCVVETPIGDIYIAEDTENLFKNMSDAEEKRDEIAGKEEKKNEKEGVCAVPEYDVPGYTGEITYVVNDNIPFFQETDMYTQSYEQYSELDHIGRCGEAMACVGTDIMPHEERESISDVKPTGWHNEKYDFVSSGGWVYNRCHLIAYCLTGENANKQNLITGTRAMNEAMIPYETDVARHVEDTNHHVMYRVTPVFEGNNMVANGVLMESRCSECSDCTFCVYCYNVQNGVYIDYSTGQNWAA